MSGSPERLDLKKLSLSLEQVIREAAGILSGYYSGAVSELAIRDKGGSPVTAADQETDSFLKSKLLALLPEAGWLSEETADDSERLKHDWVWVVDPLDGTKEFIRKIPEFCASVGLAYRGRAVLGALMNPITGEGAVGGPGLELRHWNFEKSTRNSAGARSLSSAKIITSRSEWESGALDPYKSFLPGMRQVGSAAYKLLRVAVGADDLNFYLQPKSEWDLCGGVALLGDDRVFWRLDGKDLLFNQNDFRIPCGALAGRRELVEEFKSRFC